MPTIYESFKKYELFNKPEAEILCRIDEDFFIDNHSSDPIFFYFFPLILLKFSNKEDIKNKSIDAFDKFITAESPRLSARDNGHIVFFKNLANILLYREDDIFNEFVFCLEYISKNLLFFEELGIDREYLIKNLVWKNKQKNQLHPFIAKKQNKNQLGYKIIIYLIRNWFLPRYDFDSVKKLKKALNNKTAIENKFISYVKSFSTTNNFILSIIPTIIVCLYLWADKIKVGFYDFMSFPGTFNQGSYIYSFKGKNETINAVYNTPEIFFECLFIVLIVIFFIKLKNNPLQKYLIIPRLLIGILLGYIALLGGASYWVVSILSFSTNSIWAIALTNIILLLIIFLYVRYEVRKSIGDSEEVQLEEAEPGKKKRISPKDKLNIRSLVFFRKAVWSSFFIGLVILDLFFIVYLRNVDAELGTAGFVDMSGRFHTGIIGIIDPVLLLLFFPLALVTGVVIKFILDEKPITHPIK